MCDDKVFTADTAVKIAFGAMIALLVANYLPGSLLRSAKIAIDDCERALPRNQHCIISAIPKELSSN